MGANEKYEAAMHGALSEVRMNDDLTRIKHTYADAMRAKMGVGTATFDAEFDRLIAKIKAEAKAEALEEAAGEIDRLDSDVEMYDENLNARPVSFWLRAHAEQYKEAPSA